MIALIPARAGSKRIPGKNTKPLGGKPLIRWTIEAAQESECFDRIFVCTDDSDCVAEALYCGVNTYRRLYASDEQRDIEWIVEFLISTQTKTEDVMILRPTSPFRDAATIRDAASTWACIKERYDSMRAVRLVSEHPMKMWQYDPDSHELWALMKASFHNHLHSRPTQDLGEFWVQTAGLEAMWTKTIEGGTLAGDRIAGFPLSGPAALDINDESNWAEAERLLSLVSRTIGE